MWACSCFKSPAFCASDDSTCSAAVGGGLVQFVAVGGASTVLAAAGTGSDGVNGAGVGPIGFTAAGSRLICAVAAAGLPAAETVAVGDVVNGVAPTGFAVPDGASIVLATAAAGTGGFDCPWACEIGLVTPGVAAIVLAAGGGGETGLVTPGGEEIGLATSRRRSIGFVAVAGCDCDNEDGCGPA